VPRANYGQRSAKADRRSSRPRDPADDRTAKPPLERHDGCFVGDDVESDITTLLAAGNGPKVEARDDSYGYTWLVSHHEPDDTAGLVTDLHAVNSSLQDTGFGPQLLCSLVSFTDDRDRRLALVYLYKRGTFYPFAPQAGEQRDGALELQIKALLGNDLRLEQDLSRWFPVWGAPGL